MTLEKRGSVISELEEKGNVDVRFGKKASSQGGSPLFRSPRLTKRKICANSWGKGRAFRVSPKPVKISSAQGLVFLRLVRKPFPV